jgi:hypothetical protein
MKFPHSHVFFWTDSATGTEYKILVEAGKTGSQITLYECKAGGVRYENVGFVPFPASLEHPMAIVLERIASLRAESSEAPT